MKYAFNDIVEDTVTGFVGVVTAHVEYASDDEDQYQVESIDTTGRPVDWWICESRLVPFEDEAEAFEVEQ